MRTYFVICIIVVLGQWLPAQTSDAFEQYRRQSNELYNSYISRSDSLYAAYLARSWREYALYTGVEPPSYIVQSSQKALPYSTGEIYTPEESQFRFYGQSISIAFPAFPHFLQGPSEREVSSGWLYLASSSLNKAIPVCREYIRKLQLNGWGIYQFVEAACGFYYQSLSMEEHILVKQYLLNRLGIDSKIVRNEKNQLLLLPAIQEEVYQTSYLQVNDQKYYLLAGGGQKFYTYDDHELHSSVRPLSLVIDKPLCFPERVLVEKSRTAPWGEVNFRFNMFLLNFYAQMPLCDLEVYFRSSPSDGFINQLTTVFNSRLEGKSKAEQINQLLGFIYGGFQHQNDLLTHEGEVYYFPEETFFYEYADCEDFSVLLSYLIRALVGVKTLVLYYPEHVTLAVSMDGEMDGKGIVYKGEKYLFCDPSYKNAGLGRAMRSYESLTPIVRSFD